MDKVFDRQIVDGKKDGWIKRKIYRKKFGWIDKWIERKINSQMNYYVIDRQFASLIDWQLATLFKRIVHELKIFRFLKIPSYKSNLL